MHRRAQRLGPSVQLEAVSWHKPACIAACCQPAAAQLRSDLPAWLLTVIVDVRPWLLTMGLLTVAADRTLTVGLLTVAADRGC